MRYYIYLDKEFIRDLLSAEDTNNFDIDFIEYSLQDSYSNTDDKFVKPYLENFTQNEKQLEFEKQDKVQKRTKDVYISKNNVLMSIDKSSTCNKVITRKYTNLEDISQMKNQNFYNKLVDILGTNVVREDNNINLDYGYIERVENRYNVKNYDNKHKILKINDTFVWYDQSILRSNIDFVCDVFSKVRVLSYKINENQERNFRISKAIAIFLE